MTRFKLCLSTRALVEVLTSRPIEKPIYDIVLRSLQSKEIYNGNVSFHSVHGLNMQLVQKIAMLIHR